METQEKIRIIKESFETLRARRIVKTQGDFALWCTHLFIDSQKFTTRCKNKRFFHAYFLDNNVTKTE